ncbi:hypothetical protein QTO34_016435 [Cnephaeus nilssonii]|uniref:Core shell protein Gag P30 domain-containing protein n=1 Tax=Cnephaeus nilssonii TaxID=3371016 RepID=A0AA40LRV1_CNENI|nr:hypothetical protein QTO34_016435 [Eptesicus nilssonii]
MFCRVSRRYCRLHDREHTRPKFQDWSRYSCDPTTKEELVFYCNTAWPVCTLDYGQEWPLNGSLNDYTSYSRNCLPGKWDEIPYVWVLCLHTVRIWQRKGETEWWDTPGGQPTGCYWAHIPFPTSDSLNWKLSNPSYREDTQNMADLITSNTATDHSKWADMLALLDILLMADERQLVINKANEEPHRLHQDNPNGTPNIAGAIPLAKPNLDPNSGDLAFLEHYKRCIEERLKKKIPKQKSLIWSLPPRTLQAPPQGVMP